MKRRLLHLYSISFSVVCQVPNKDIGLMHMILFLFPFFKLPFKKMHKTTGVSLFLIACRSSDLVCQVLHAKR